jgi:biofilm PGA synthesis N-glycosyltransferase PgaC
LDSKISIFIPVYRESDLLKPLLNRILNDPYNLKEVFVIIDEPTKKSLELSEEFKDQVKFIFNGERKGKANVLNEAVKRSNGELLLFLDGDVAIPTEPIHFLETVFDEAKDVDIVEFKKNVIRDSFLARIVNYDYLSFNSTNWLFSLTLKKCLGFNGAAFAIKRRAFESLGGFRRVISEDLDLGTRSFIKGYSFKYTKKIEVHNKVSPSWRQWFKQRKRWGIGTALWLKDYYRDLLANTRKHPKILLPSLFLILPLPTSLHYKHIDSKRNISQACVPPPVPYSCQGGAISATNHLHMHECSPNRESFCYNGKPRGMHAHLLLFGAETRIRL